MPFALDRQIIKIQQGSFVNGLGSENPVRDRLSFNYYSAEVQQTAIKIYSLTGKILVSQKISSFKGNNLITIPLSSGFNPGMYVIEINTDIISQTTKFIKQ